MRSTHTSYLTKRGIEPLHPEEYLAQLARSPGNPQNMLLVVTWGMVLVLRLMGA
jgi:hypothetical protein